MKCVITTLVALASVATAHFTLSYPRVRNYNEDKLGQYPCGSFNTPSQYRTPWPMNGGSIALEMGHTSSTIEVTLAFGNDPGSAFNTIIRRPVQQNGLGSFCMTGLNLPNGVTVQDGTNATIQVITNGDPNGGLYNCADITFSMYAQGPGNGVCRNNTGVSASFAANQRQPNETNGNNPTNAPKSDAATVQVGLGALVLAGFLGLVMVL